MKDKLRLLVTGATGLVGSSFVHQNAHNFNILTAGRNNADIKLDLLQKEQIIRIVTKLKIDVVINFAAFTHVDEAQKQNNDKSGDVYALNTLAPYYLAKACVLSAKKLYQISTDYVFDGKNEDNPYTEEDQPCPLNSWYSKTKFFAEQKIMDVFKGKNSYVIIRISNPYSPKFNKKLDIVRAILDTLTKNQPYLAPCDQKIKPTSVFEIAGAIKLLLMSEASGIYNVAGEFNDSFITPYQFAQKIARFFNFDTSLIYKTTFERFSTTRKAPRPKNSWLDTSKIKAQGMNFLSFEENLRIFKNDYKATQDI